MNELIQDFVTETREGIEALDGELVRFEQNPENPEILGEIFRLIHTIKGTCGFIGLARLQTVAHAAETVLGGFRDGTVLVSPESVSAVLETVDLIRDLIDGLARDGIEREGDDQALIERLEAASHVLAGRVDGPPADATVSDIPVVTQAQQSSGPLLARLGGEATLDAACEMTIGQIAGLPLLAGALSAIDPDRLQAVLRDDLCAAARCFGDAARLALSLNALVGAPLSGEAIKALLEAIRADLIRLDVAGADAAELVALVGPAQSVIDDWAAEAAADAGVAEPAAPSRPIPAAPSPIVRASSGTEPESTVAQTIRVNVDSLEQIMTVVSELVLIRNQLLQLLRIDPESPFAAPLYRLNQVTSELQEGVMTTRMQPINGAWSKLPRLVRDLANDLGKKIELTTEGQDTELDRQVLEMIKDPLTHMVRNAADHGIETIAERRAAGKPDMGRISLAARHEGGAIVIEMSDDGRGLPAARIRAKAVATGVITAQQAEAMSDAEARQLIFLPGFSTAGEVTSVSGRGVGMDVVRTNIEKIGGTIELDSVEGAGTRFIIHIPLTLTIISALIIESCGERFAMPQSSVVELVSAGEASEHTIEHVNGAAVLRLRDRLLPLVSLETLLGLPAENARRDETCIVVARVGAASFGVIVDRVFDTEEIVVKPVSSVLRHLKLYCGATILGDGAVIMILDFKGLSPVTAASKAIGAPDDEAIGHDERPHVETAAILLFRSGENALKAVPVAAVARIEEIDGGQVEWVDGRSVIQYRGELIPVVGGDSQPVRPNLAAGPHPLLVFAQNGRSAGLLVEEIVDIVENSLIPELKPRGDGSLGSLTIDGRATELIDVGYYWRCATGETLAAPEPAATTALKRLLVIDQSPFSQLLLRPLLAQAGYEVTVAGSPESALALHDAGDRFDLIMADTSTNGPDTRQMALAFSRASGWHTTPLLGLGVHKAGAGQFDETTLLDAVSSTFEGDSAQMRGAACWPSNLSTTRMPRPKAWSRSVSGRRPSACR